MLSDRPILALVKRILQSMESCRDLFVTTFALLLP